MVSPEELITLYLCALGKIGPWGFEKFASGPAGGGRDDARWCQGYQQDPLGWQRAGKGRWDMGMAPGGHVALPGQS